MGHLCFSKKENKTPKKGGHYYGMMRKFNSSTHCSFSSKTILQHGSKQIAKTLNKRIKKGIKGRMIVSGHPDSPVLKEVLKKDEKELRKSIVVSPNTYPIKASIVVLDDMVFIFTSEEDPFAVLIKNKDVADSVNSIHDMVWDRFSR